MLRRLRTPEASSRGSNSIIFSCVISFSSWAGALFIGFPIVFCLSKSLVFSPSKLKSSSPQIYLKSSLCSLGTVPRIFLNNLCEWCDIRASRTHFGTEKALSTSILWLDTSTIARCNG